MAHRGILESFEYWTQTIPEKPFLRQSHEGHWIEISWGQASIEVAQLTRALERLNLLRGSRIGILSKNCAHWILADLAIWRAGHVSVPLFPTARAETLSTILDVSGTDVVFVGKLENWESLRGTLTHKNRKFVGFPLWAHAGVESFESFTAQTGAAVLHSKDLKREESEIATLIYSSGTTGQPKGVVHTFLALNFAGANGAEILDYKPGFSLISYLPLAHVVERTLIELAGISGGVTISFVDSLPTFARDLASVQPHLFVAVPRIWAKFQEGLFKKFGSAKLNFLLRVPGISFLLRKLILKKLGLSRARFVLTGGGPMSVELIEWYKKLGLLIRQGYGLTENLGYAHFSLQKLVKDSTVGQAMPNNTTKISAEGEVLLRSPATMLGYYKNEKATSEALTDGFLRTGDQGSLDGAGYLTITGRLKELFKTAKGKYILPAPIEARLQDGSWIDSVCVVGSGMPAGVAIVSLGEMGRQAPSQILIEHLEKTLASVNAENEKHEAIKHILVSKDTWSIENGFLTPTLKVKRIAVETAFKGQISEVFEKKQTVWILP